MKGKEMDNSVIDKCPAPFWFWNGNMNEEECVKQLNAMHEQGVPAFVLHARVGLKTPYLGEKWFSCVSAVLRRAAELNMQAWIYDEENFPSGYGGGRVLEKYPYAYGKHLKIRIGGISDENADVTEKNLTAINEYGGKKYAFTCCKTLWRPAYADTYYIDVIGKDAGAHFTECVHEEYYRRFGNYFGNVIRGFFTDEPGFYNNIHYTARTNDDDTVVWTDDFAEEFYSRRGYDILPCLCHVFRNLDETSAAIRKDFFDTAGELYRERFLLPIKKYCNDRGVKLIGHLHMEDYFHFQIGTQGDFFRALSCLDFAGLDRIDKNFDKITEKVVSSAAHTSGVNAVASESFACSGWELDFTQMRSIADRQFVRGVNFLVPHAFYYSIEDFRKWEAAPSQFIQNPYWKYYGEFARYIQNVCAALQTGKPYAQILVYYPRDTAMAKYEPDDFLPCIEFDNKLQDAAFALLEGQLDFDFVDEASLLREDGLFVGGTERDLLVLPFVERISTAFLKKLLVLKKPILILGDENFAPLYPCEREEFEKTMRAFLAADNVSILSEKALKKSYTYRFNGELLCEEIKKRIVPVTQLKYPDARLTYTVRRTTKGELYFWVNEEGTVKENRFILQGIKTVRMIDCFNQSSSVVPVEYIDGKTQIPVRFSPWESKLFSVTEGKSEKPIDDYANAFTDRARFEKLLVNDKEFLSPGLWNEKGEKDFSGTGRYCFRFKKEFEAEKIFVDAGRVFNVAEAFINGKSMGVKIFPPYVFDATDLVQEENILTVEVTNTLANEFEKKDVPSGMEESAKVIYIGIKPKTNKKKNNKSHV
ncbi:MAG: glycosyl hydrolase [Candidatus Borkfalkiaceae bacterium]|nr:glycosyl hydrolase [Clostridia bacterium]MDY6222793.1 glycosyl hydrolase [Christensenellaceae bacterium]